MKIHMLDVGDQIYGDCILAVDGDTRILVDGSHPGDFEQRGSARSIPDQLRGILGGEKPIRIDLLVVTHCHLDHIGCLPTLVRDKIIKCRFALVAHEKLGFPHVPEDESRDAALDSMSRQVLAALREEPRIDFRGKRELDAFLSDALNLEERYRQMLKMLEDSGAEVVRYTSPADAGVQKIEAAFAHMSLKVLGPTKEHLLLCADAIAKFNSKARDALDTVRSAHADLDAASLYRMFVSDSLEKVLSTDSLEEFLDMPGKGAALNDQSILLKIGQSPDAALLTGDMQFADAEVAGLDGYMSALLQSAATAGPYAFVKLPHHASYNGFDEDVLAAFKDTSAFGISTGRGDSRHPNEKVLSLLKKNRKRIDWARTDKNRLVTVTLQNGEPEFEIEQGKLDDFSPNAAVDVSQTPIETPAASVTETPAISSQVVHSLSPLPGEQPPVRSGSLADYVEVTARIPHVTTRVTIAIDVAPAIIRPLEPPKPVVEPPSPRDQEQRLARPRLAGGRPLPDLLFVTCSPRLAANVGAREAAATLAAIRDAGKVVHDVRVVENPFPEVRGAAAGKQGVVILGGYDVLPSQRYDVPPPDIRRAVGNRSGDPDNFVVWSDQGYGDTDGDGLADLPVSRIPDGRSVDLLWAALSSAPRQRSQRRFGLRNDARPFAIDVFDARMPGPEVMLASQPTGHSGLKPGNIDADAIYIMLHGSDLDGATFWGEDDASYIEAMKVSNIPDPCGGVVFAGCCWGALTVRTKAKDYRPGDPIQILTPEQSIALSFLRRGAMAFVGCTGAHYSPERVAPDRKSYFGGPMHDAFWKRIGEKMFPAEALFSAKKDYISGMPHDRVKPVEQAVEYKILRAFTCLGLGW